MRYLLLILFFSSSAFAQWIQVDDDGVFIELETIKLQRDNVVRFNFYINSKEQGHSYSTLNYVEADCIDSSFRILSSRRYEGHDLQNESELQPADPSKIIYAPPKSKIEYLLETTCKAFNQKIIK